VDCGLCSAELERQQLVLLALLVGSDYTPGIQGVGPVTALEVLAAFPADGRDNNILRGLQMFRDWWHGGMTVGPGKTSLKNKLKDVQFVEGICSYCLFHYTICFYILNLLLYIYYRNTLKTRGNCMHHLL
jgi:hypothetical protein